MIALSHHLWVPDESGGVYILPPQVSACIDLRSTLECGTPGVDVFGSLLCLLPDDAKLDDSFTVLASGDARDARPSAKILDAIESLRGYRPRGDTLAACIADLLMAGADPLGFDRCKPLMPNVSRQLEMFCGGRLWSRAFAFGTDPHTNAVQSVLQAEFRQTFDAVQDGKLLDSNMHLKVLDYWCDKYRIDKSDRSAWEKLVPVDLRAEIEGPRKHSTTIIDDFTRADGATIGNQLTWTETNWSTVSNAAKAGDATISTAVATSALSSSDNYAQVDVTIQGTGTATVDRIVGPACRATDQNNHYFCGVTSGTVFRLFKDVAATRTQIGSGTTVAVSLPDTAKVEANGSTISSYWNGAVQDSVTDTALASGTLGGLWDRNLTTGGTIDNFEAADLAAGGLDIAIAAYHYNHHLMSMC